MIPARAASGVALGGAVILWGWAGFPFFQGFVLLAGLGVALECIRMVRASGLPGGTWIVAGGLGAGLVLAWHFVPACLSPSPAPGPGFFPVIASGCLVLAVLASGVGLALVSSRHPACSGDKRNLFARTGTLGVALWAGWAFGGWAVMPGFDDPDVRISWLVPLWLAVVLTDTGAWAGGKLLGGPRLAVGISPGKTWSGAVCGVLAAVGGIQILARVIPGFPGAETGWPALVLVSAASQTGDLVESAFKRLHGAKDSGALIPGHGGLFDRLDGFAGVHAALAWGMVLQGGGYV